MLMPETENIEAAEKYKEPSTTNVDAVHDVPDSPLSLSDLPF